MAHKADFEATDMAVPVMPELSGQLRDYPFNKRVEILRTHPIARFMGTGHSEINDAFAAVLDHDVTGQGADGRLSDIGEHARKTAPKGEADGRAIRAITRVTSRHSAYAHQAERDKRWLKFMRQEVQQSLEAGGQYGSLAEFVGATGMLPYEGPGQVVRYVDSARYVLGKQPDGRFTFGAQLDKNGSGQSIVVDAFTARTLMPAMEQYQREVLGEVSMDVALELLGYAMSNEIKRERFWEWDLRQASRQEVARPVAVAALQSLSG